MISLDSDPLPTLGTCTHLRECTSRIFTLLQQPTRPVMKRGQILTVTAFGAHCCEKRIFVYGIPRPIWQVRTRRSETFAKTPLAPKTVAPAHLGCLSRAEEGCRSYRYPGGLSGRPSSIQVYLHLTTYNAPYTSGRCEGGMLSRDVGFER